MSDWFPEHPMCPMVPPPRPEPPPGRGRRERSVEQPFGRPLGKNWWLIYLYWRIWHTQLHLITWRN